MFDQALDESPHPGPGGSQNLFIPQLLTLFVQASQSLLVRAANLASG
jgi:hypothetical protein